MSDEQQERLRRWRLILGKSSDGTHKKLSAADKNMDDTLEALYGQKPGLRKGGKGYATGRSNRGSGEDNEHVKGDADGEGERQGGLEESRPGIARWLGDIREYFPASVVRVMQRDALDRLDMTEILMEPELLELVEPDIHLVADLISLSKAMPGKTRESAKLVVRKVVEELERKLQNPMRQAIHGSLNRSDRNYRPRFHEINWHGTIRRNLKHYQPDLNTIIPETLIGYGKRRSSLRDIILCVDQSGSMASSVVYSSIFGAVMASLSSINTHMVVFDTSVVDLTEKLDDPVELLFGTQLGGGTDINRALGYCQGLINRPRDTILILISDLYEGGDSERMMSCVHQIVNSGVQMIALLTLSDDGAPAYDVHVTSQLKDLGVPAFACTPDLFPDLMAAAINRKDMGRWAADNDIVTVG